MTRGTWQRPGPCRVVAGLIAALWISGCGSTVAPTAAPSVGVDALTAGDGMAPAPMVEASTGASSSGEDSPAHRSAGPEPAAGSAGASRAAADPSAVPPMTDRSRRMRQPTAGPGRADGPAAGTKPVLIGVEIIKNGDAAFRTIGLNVSYGDQRAQVQALVDFINAHGGAGGRPVDVVVYENDVQSESSYTTREQQACTAWTEDARVDIAASPLVHTPLLAECLSTRGVPFFNTGATADDESLAADPSLFLVNRLTLTRAMRIYVEALVDAGFFPRGAKVGVVYADAEPFRRVKDHTLIPALQRHGIRVEQTAGINIEDQQAYVAGAHNAVLQFSSAGVNRVLFVEKGGGLPFIFATTAEGQGYRPRYGFDSDNGPAYLAGALPAAQLVGALGVGWLPVADGGPDNAALSPGGRRCVRIHGKAGEKSNSSTKSAFMADFCDLLLFAQTVVSRGAGRTDRASIVAAAESTGAGFRPASTFAVHITPERHDGATVARPFAYREKCSCFAYAGRQRVVP